jgi:hypothetical protein
MPGVTPTRVNLPILPLSIKWPTLHLLPKETTKGKPSRIKIQQPERATPTAPWISLKASATAGLSTAESSPVPDSEDVWGLLA